MAALRTIYVDPGVVGGTGDGSTFANAYSSLNVAENAEDGDITLSTGSDEYVVFECRSTGGTADTATVTVIGWTTAADNYILVRAHVNHRPDGIYGNVSDSYRLETVDAACISVDEAYVRFDGLQVKITYATSDTFKICFQLGTSETDNDLRVDNCYVDCNPGATVKYIGMSLVGADSSPLIRNTIVVNFPRRGVQIAAGTAKLVNCTIAHISTVDGIRDTQSSVVCVNCAVFDTPDDFSGVPNIDYCASDDGDGTNAVAPSGADWDLEFTDPGNDDFRILNTGNLYQAGKSQTADSDVPSTDIAGNPRTDGSESIGAFEFAATGDPVITPDALALALTLHAPTIVIDCTVTPATLELALTQHAPPIIVSGDVTVTPDALALALTQHAPTVVIDCTVAPATLELALTLETPTIVIPGAVTVTPDALALALTLEIPTIITGYVLIPPAMHEALIDPYSGGAWLWLVRINIPGYASLWYARNTEDIVYGGQTYAANNFDVGLASLSGEGSVPRYGLIVAQDADHTLEDKINATQGAGGGTVKIIRCHEDFLDNTILELEQLLDILTANSDTKNVVFHLGIPNPLLKKIPLRRYTSKRCPYALPSLFKGPECQYAGGDATCTGLYEDCFTKGNSVHWGAEIGLDPAVSRA